MKKKKLFVYVIFVALVIGFWNLFDFLYSSIITHSEYQFGVVDDLVFPLVIGVVMGCFLFLRKK